MPASVSMRNALEALQRKYNLTVMGHSAGHKMYNLSCKFGSGVICQVREHDNEHVTFKMGAINAFGTFDYIDMCSSFLATSAADLAYTRCAAVANLIKTVE